MSTHQVGIVKVNDAELVSFKDKQDGAIYVALKPIVERIGLAWNPQWRKVKADSTQRRSS